jgi:cyclic pyranopterin phosphate synthase
MRDHFGRLIRYLRVSVTDRCNLRCSYCAAEASCESGIGEALPLESMAAIVRAAVGLGVDKVRITGGEPLLREGLFGFVSSLASIPGLGTLAMTTNGTHLATAARELASAGLMSVNVSLDSIDPDEYGRLTGGGRLEDTLSGIAAAKEAGLDVKLNVVVDAHDPPSAAREKAVANYAQDIGVALQTIRRYDPLSPKIDDPDYDRPPPCAACDRIRLLSDGRLLACLHSAAVLPIDLEHIEESILTCVAMKSARGYTATLASLREIGG